MNPKLTKEYRSQITLNDPSCVVTLTSPSLDGIQQHVGNLLGTNRGKTRFEKQPGTPTILVFNSEVAGDATIGWIAEYEVPVQLSIQALAEHRQSVQRAA